MKHLKLLIFSALIFSPLLSFAQTDNGKTLWAKSTTSGSANSIFWGVATDSNGNQYGAGFIYGTGTYGFGNEVAVSGSSGNANILLVKYDASGTALWAKSTVSGGFGSSNINSVATDSSGNVYVVGEIYGNVTYDLGNGITVQGSAIGPSYSNIFVAKYDTSGNALWAKSTTSGPNKTSMLFDLAVDSDGNVYVAGSMYDTDTYGFGDGITAAGSGTSYNIILIKYDTNGVTKWAKTVSGSTNSSRLYDVAIDNYGDPYVGGAVTGTTAYNFGNNVTVTPGGSGSNVLMAKYNSTGSAQWATSTINAPNSSTLKAIALDSDGDIFAAGYLDGSGTYEFGNGVNITASYNGENAFLLKYNSTGYAQWTKNPTIAPDASIFEGVAADDQGNVYATGYIKSTLQYDFGNNVTVKGVSSDNNLILVNYDNSGNPILAKSVTSGNSTSQFYKVFADNAAPGDIYTGGYIDGTSPYNLGNNITVNGSYTGRNPVIVKYHGNYTDPESSSYPSSSSSVHNNNSSSSSSSSKKPIASSSSSNPAVVSEASSIKHGVPKLFAVGGAILLLF